MWLNPQESADLVTSTEEILNVKFHFLKCLFSCFSCGKLDKTLVICNVWKPGLYIFSFLTKEEKRKKIIKKEKFHTLFFKYVMKYWNEV